MSRTPDPTHTRYSRQAVLEELGQDGQEKLCNSSVVVIGCGGLGCTVVELLTRAGVGRVRIIDRDIVELDNLHRQMLFDEEDARARTPKAVAARARLNRINRDVVIETQVVDLGPANVLSLLHDVDLVLDGTDNTETRYLLNDACLELGVPWIYGGAVGTSGMMMSMVPEGPCLRCIFPEPPVPGSLPACEARGVLNALPVLVASLQATESIKMLTGAGVTSDLVIVDPWQHTFKCLPVPRIDDCPACSQGRRDFLGRFADAR
jgi:adenylyltransferase/sulfurtransferase